MRYLIDDRDADETTALALYRTVVRWAAGHADRFLISLQPHVYDDPETVERFSCLGKLATISDAGASAAQDPRTKLLNQSSENVKISGTPTQEFARALTEQPAPPRAIAGDLSPVEDISLFNGQRTLYALYDYGRTQILDLDEPELGNLHQTLHQAELATAFIVVAPPYTTGLSGQNPHQSTHSQSKPSGPGPQSGTGIAS